MSVKMSSDGHGLPHVDNKENSSAFGLSGRTGFKSNALAAEIDTKGHTKAPLGVHITHSFNGEGGGGNGANQPRSSGDGLLHFPFEFSENYLLLILLDNLGGSLGGLPKYDPETTKAQVSLLRSRLASLGSKKSGSQLQAGTSSGAFVGPTLQSDPKPSPRPSASATPSSGPSGQPAVVSYSGSNTTPTESSVTPGRNTTLHRSSDEKKTEPRSAEAWWEHLVEQYRSGAASPDDLLTLTKTVIFPQLDAEKGTLKQNDSYLNIWLLFAKLQPQGQEGLEERHKIYQWMFHEGIGRKNASLYLNWLQFEVKQNHQACIREVLRLALQNEAEPSSRIHDFMTQIGVSLHEIGDTRKSQQFGRNSLASSAGGPSAPLQAGPTAAVLAKEKAHSQVETADVSLPYADARASFQAPHGHQQPPQPQAQPQSQHPAQSQATSAQRSSQVSAPQPRNTAVESKLAELRTKWTQASQLLSMGVMVVRGTPYLNLGRIGNGGSSKVYKVLSAANMQIYAVKVVNLVDQDESVIRQYINEVALLKEFTSRAMEARQQMRDNPAAPPYNHNIIELIDFEHNKEKKMLLIVLEFAEIDLHKLLKNYGGQLVNNLNLLRYYWEGMLRAVQTVHEHRIVHSDLKPPNFVVVKGQVKLIDFGIAKAISQNTTNIVRQDIIGTMNYMAPEAIGCVGSSSKALKVGRPADVWALGCILYQMVYGAPPFAHIENMLQKLQVIGNPSYKIEFPTHHHNVPIPEQIINVMASCLQREPKERPTIPDLLQHSMLRSM